MTPPHGVSTAVAFALVLPGPATPGAVNPQVAQATIHSTVCVRGWTATVRPPYAYTHRLKLAQLDKRGLPGPSYDYEEDHLIPLELGGAPTDPRNLWPQPWSAARRDDRLENALRRAVCAGRLSLAAARARIVAWKERNG